ncbi:MAG: methyltransferase domain-containing protein [Myxococcaceae bacterium]|nr:methyltransferase domain-containing protein [Myxococcaceae bacterium]
MEQHVFHGFRDLAERLAGITLHDGAATLVTARVAGRLRELELASEEQYLALLQSEDGAGEAVHFLDAISTGFTSFWREGDHFVDLAARARRALAAGQRRFRYWSAACSAGHEPYSMAVALEPVFRGLDVDWKILATDLSTRRLQRAAAGVYARTEVAALPAAARAAYFEPAGEHPAFGRLYRVRETLKGHVVFRRLNLAQPPFPMRGPLDAVFCRNVMIYFGAPVRRALVAEVERLLAPGGALYVGQSEPLSHLGSGLQAERPTVLVRPTEGRQ